MKSKTVKQAEAAERQAKYDALTVEQKYARAIKRGHAGTREAKRLIAVINGKAKQHG